MARQRRPQHRTPVAGKTIEELRRQVEILSDEVAALQRAGESTISVPEVDTRQPEVDLSRSVMQAQRDIRRLDMHRQTMQRDLYDVVRQVWVAEVYDTYLLARPATVRADTGGLSMTEVNETLVVARAPNQQYSVGDLIRVVRVLDRLGVQADDGRDCLYMALSSNEYYGPFYGRVSDDGKLTIGNAVENWVHVGTVQTMTRGLSWLPTGVDDGDYYIYLDISVLYHATANHNPAFPEYSGGALSPYIQLAWRYQRAYVPNGYTYPVYWPPQANFATWEDDTPGIVRNVANRNYVVIGVATVAGEVVTGWRQYQYGEIRLGYEQPNLFLCQIGEVDGVPAWRMGVLGRAGLGPDGTPNYPDRAFSNPIPAGTTISGAQGRLYLVRDAGDPLIPWRLVFADDIPVSADIEILVGRVEVTISDSGVGGAPLGGEAYVSTLVEYQLPIDLTIYNHSHPEP